jgi:hypothetical protein
LEQTFVTETSPHLPPTQLVGRASHVAVHASHLALCDLGKDPLGCGRPRQPRDGRGLYLDVIELQNIRVGLAAVDAGMRAQILEDELVIPFAIARRIRVHVGDVLLTVLAVPRALT